MTVVVKLNYLFWRAGGVVCCGAASEILRVDGTCRDALRKCDLTCERAILSLPDHSHNSKETILKPRTIRSSSSARPEAVRKRSTCFDAQLAFRIRPLQPKESANPKIVHSSTGR